MEEDRQAHRCSIFDRASMLLGGSSGMSKPAFRFCLEAGRRDLGLLLWSDVPESKQRFRADVSDFGRRFEFKDIASTV